MRTKLLMKFAQLLTPGLILAASLTLTLTACAGRDQISQPATATASHSAAPQLRHDARPLACSELEPVALHAGKITPAGKPDVQKADVVARLDLPDWEAQLRRLFGDTASTIASTRKNNAVLARLCGTP